MATTIPIGPSCEMTLEANKIGTIRFTAKITVHAPAQPHGEVWVRAAESFTFHRSSPHARQARAPD
jgi:hypothetical protein